jgi:formate/nitrite transporter
MTMEKNADPDGGPPHLDPLLPAAIAREAEAIGARKARLDPVRLFVLGILGGAFIALGAMFATTVLADAGTIPFGIARLLAGLVFSLGLMLVVAGGAELFTGNTLMVIALAAGRIRATELARAWTVVYVGNLAGALGTAVLVFLAGHHLLDGGEVGRTAVAIGATKTALPFARAFFLGVLCNVLVCLAVWLSIGARSTTDKLAAVILPVSAFVAAGFEHSVANMYFIPLAGLIQAFGPPELAAAGASLGPAGFLGNLVPVTLGNIVGGCLLVGAVYWFVYLKPTRPRP